MTFWSCNTIGTSNSITWCWGIINGINAFFRSRQTKLGVTWLFGHVMLLVPVSAHIMPMAPLHSLGQDKYWKEVQYSSFVHMMSLALAWAAWCQGNGHWYHCILQVRTFKKGATWLFGHVIPLAPVSASHETNGIIKATNAYFGQDDQNRA